MCVRACVRVCVCVCVCVCVYQYMSETQRQVETISFLSAKISALVPQNIKDCGSFTRFQKSTFVSYNLTVVLHFLVFNLSEASSIYHVILFSLFLLFL